MSDQHKEIKIADEKRFNFKQFVLTKIVKHWYLYVISLMVILPLAYYYNWYTTPQYNAVSTLLINDQKSKFSQEDLLAQMSSLDNTGGVDNEIELIRSRSMIAKTLRKLDYEVDYFEQCLSESFDVIRRERLTSKTRILYFAKSRSDHGYKTKQE